MNVPADLLLLPWPQADSAPLLQTVFRVLKTVATGSSQAGGASPHRTAQADTSDADSPIDNVAENLLTSSPLHSPVSSPVKNWHHMSPDNSGQQRSPSVKIVTGESEANMKAVRLAAKMVFTRFPSGVATTNLIERAQVMDHLINHIGHFPMGIGAARLSSIVVEHDDLPGFTGDELSSEIFQSPSVQFFVLNRDTLMSLVELPALEVPGGGITSGLRTARSQVRVILRNLGGKSCWDASVLYSLREDMTLSRRQSMFSAMTRPPPREELMLTSSFVGVGGLQPSPPRLSVRHRPAHCLPKWEDTAEDMDNLDDASLE